MNKKTVMVLGLGAQGFAAARCFDKEPSVEKIICADADPDALKQVDRLKKGIAVRVDAADKNSIVEAARGVYLLVNAMPLSFTPNVMDAALEVGAHYQDYAASTAFAKEWVDSIHYQFDVYGPKFEKAGLLALVGTGSAPGLICAATRDAMRYLDSCETIRNMVWEGVIAKRFQPFWWSPEVALEDMSELSYAYIDGKLIRREPYTHPAYRPCGEDWGHEPLDIAFCEHSHDEPVYYSLHPDEYFKGVKNIVFKYAGAGMDFARPLYQAGLLSREPEDFNGQKIVPYDLVLRHLPPAPKTEAEIRQILDEGLISDAGYMEVSAIGKKDGRDIEVITLVNSPGLAESFAKAGITAEMYLTGQGGFLFSRLILEGHMEQTGLITSDMLTMEQVDIYFDYAKDLDITLSTRTVDITGWGPMNPDA